MALRKTSAAEARRKKLESILNQAISSGYYGNEYAYGLLGDAYLKKGETKKAIEFYKKSGSIDFQKKIKRLEGA